MKCEKCHQNEATVFLTQTHNGETVEVHLCDACAKENEQAIFDDGISFQQFLSGLLENNKSPQVKTHTFTCKSCGMSIADFKKNSLVGCADCYRTFLPYLRPIIKRLQSNVIHTGKRPCRQDESLKYKQRIEQFESELKIALMQENYEQAAILRDQIRDFRKEETL